MSEKTNIHGHWVVYAPGTDSAVRYLKNDLDSEEARVFFDQARSKGYCKFEDEHEGQYILRYRSGEYKLEKR
ncbi:MAG TPA: hypothetical protein ENL33_00370 [Candidatus Parcubacteria bacterium]|nr:hypothetical protein [Candidatus Parcubacteria bacterium]